MSRRPPSGTMTTPMQSILLLGGVLVTIAWGQLFVLSEDTEDYFAWTIAPPLSAAFLGAFYGGAAVVAFLSGREREWDRARIGVPGVIAFTWLTLGATLLHLDKFHLDEGEAFARFAGWVWLAVYILVPTALTIAYVGQRSRAAKARAGVDSGTPSPEPPRTGPDPAVGAAPPLWLRALLVGLAAISLGMGAGLFLVPEDTPELWPWPLTPLVARAASAWLVGVGLLFWALGREPDRREVRAGFVGMVAIGVLQLLALTRFTDTVDWSAVRAWVYVLALVAMTAGGLYGWLAPVTGDPQPRRRSARG